ncbi:autotransporter adhesin YapE [Paraburkholderia jirisanensis]
MALTIAGTLPQQVCAQDFVVNSQADLINAINAANASGDASSTIEFGSSFGVNASLPAATRSVTLDTQGFTLTANGLIWSGTVTIDGALTGVTGGGSTTGAGLQLNGSSVSTSLVNNGHITGGAAIAGGAAGIGLFQTSGTVVNNGTISGGNALTGGTPGFGVQPSRGGTLINNGTIQGGNTNGTSASGGAGINFGVLGATLINNGTIRGGSDLSGVNPGGAALFVRTGAAPIINTGTLAGGNDAVAVIGNAAFTLINSGTIQAGSGQATAIQAAASGATAALTLELQAGSVIVGNVVANAAATGNTLILGGTANDVFDVSSIGPAAQYQNFNSFEKTGTSTWALTGTGTTATAWTIQQGTLQIGNGAASGSIVGNVTDNATLAFDRSDTFAFGNSVSGTGALNQVGTGTTILTAANSFSGGTNVMAGTLAVGDAAHTGATLGTGLTTVSAGATLGGYGSVPGSVNNSGTVAAANALSAFASGNAGTLHIGGNLDNAGIVKLAAASGQAGNVLNVGGNYTGINGQVVLNTVLNQGGSASQTDRLTVNGNAGGSTTLQLNRSGTGAATVGNGIQLVQVGGTSAANSFHLAGPIQAGAYQYLLYQGGAADANGWYLRSQFEPATNGANPTAGSPDGTAANANALAGAGAAIAYRPAVVGYSVTPLLNTDYGFTLLGRLHERVGDIASAESGATPSANRNGVWGRIGGQNLDADAGDRFSADERTFFAQFGKDWTLSRGTEGGSTHAGATVSFGSTSASFSDSARGITGQLSDAAGTVETQAQSVGGYWTRYLRDGAYFDAVGQLTHYQNQYGDIYGDAARQQGFGAGVSGEAGKPFALGASGIAIEPQAQLLYQYVHLNHFDDGISEIGSNTTNALRGRLGFRLFKANLSNDAKNSTLTPYLSADVLHDFFTPGQTSVGGASLQNELGKTWFDVGVGMTGSFGKHSELYANVTYAHSISGDYRRNVFGQAGYRFGW